VAKLNLSGFLSRQRWRDDERHIGWKEGPVKDKRGDPDAKRRARGEAPRAPKQKRRGDGPSKGAKRKKGQKQNKKTERQKTERRKDGLKGRGLPQAPVDAGVPHPPPLENRNRKVKRGEKASRSKARPSAKAGVIEGIISAVGTVSRSRALKSRLRTEPPGRGTPFEAYFASEPLPGTQPALIFQHLQKTAGTAMREIIHKTLATQTEATIEHVVLDVRKTNDGSVPLRNWYEDWWASLGEDRRDRLVLATSHSANYLLDIIERPTRAFMIVREPADRVASRYYFRSNPPRWSLRDLYNDPARFPRTRGQFFNYQSRALLEPRFDVESHELTLQQGPPPSADLWRSRLRSILDQDYLVGVQERFHETVSLFAKEFGWPMVIEPEVRVNRQCPREWDDTDTKELLLAYNWLDMDLYEECTRRMDRQLAATA
jgi:hypothetical protein